MHEVSLMQDLLELACEHARRRRASRIHRVVLRIGDLAGVVPEALELAFEVVTRGSMAEGACLEVEPVSAVCWCAGCREEFHPTDFMLLCPRCEQARVEVRHGRELELAWLEVS